VNDRIDQLERDILERLLDAGRIDHIDALGASTAQVRGALEQLRGKGCVIEAHPQGRVELVRTGLACWADYIEPRHRHGMGRRLSVYRQTASTQDVARQLVQAVPNGQGGHVIVTDHQTAGRGRMERRWFTTPGSALLMTAIHQTTDLSVDRLALGACVAVAEATERIGAPPPQIRWPNDVMIDSKKLAGILVQCVGRLALIGIGINVSTCPADLPEDDAGRPIDATSLIEHDLHVDRLKLLDVLLGRMDQWLTAADDRALHDAWRARSCLQQKRITVLAAGRRVTGRVVDIDPREGLMLANDRGAVITLSVRTTSIESV